jgi:hypothetical protein
VAYDQYTLLFVVRGFARLTEAVAAAESRILTDGGRTPQERQRDGQRIRRAYTEYERSLTEIAKRISVIAEREIKAKERSSRVRPDTRGDGGPRLNKGVGKSRAITAIPGTVGVNDHEWAVSHGVDWWWTNEVGYSGHIGRVVHGFFYDAGWSGRARPDPSRSREHPLFRPEGFQRASGYRQLDSGGAALRKRARKRPKGGRPGMLIANPIPARHFVREGALTAERHWHTEVERARQRFLRQIVGI